MKLSETLALQRKLQGKLEYKPTRGELVVAFVAELGEFLNAAKGAWAWWKRHGETFDVDNERAIDELADLMHFALALVLKDGKADESGILLRDFDTKDMPDVVRHALEAAGSVRFSRRLPLLVIELGKFLGIDEQAILDAYEEKAQVNLDRWESSKPRRKRKKPLTKGKKSS